MPELKARCFVGLDNKFIMTAKFPDTEDYAGLHELLDEFIGYDDVFAEEPLQMGLYELEFTMTQDILFNPERDMSDAYLELLSYKRIDI